jgi:hypothetical protein
VPKLSDSELKALLAAERMDALASASASKLSDERSDALDYYMGDMSKDMPALEGRSKAVSTDVADTVEGLMPQLMEIFCGGDEVVRFDPVGPEDMKAAEQETDYVNHVFMQKNPGFLVLYGFIKDALLSKTGIVKVFTEEQSKEERQTYLDQPEDAFAMLAANPELEIVEHTAHESGLHDVTVAASKAYKCHKVEGVPPEEFGIRRNARNIQDSGYCFHEVLKSEADLIAQKYDVTQIKGLPSYTQTDGIETNSRDTVEEGQGAGGDDGMNSANRQIKVTEHYVRMDYEGNDKPTLYRVTTGGEQGDILKRDGKADIVPVNRIPFAAMTPIIVTHRFFGRSIADLVMDIQRIKTALLRGLLDNTYLAVNPRPEIAESHASETTLDDLLTSRPGAPIRTRQPGGLNWQQMPFVGGELLPVLQMMDATREWRTGVTRQGQGVDPKALQNQVATIANQQDTAARAKCKLIARIFAETGIRDMFALLHAEIREHGDQAATVRLRNEWVTVDPRQWKSRDDMTINVGLGPGTREQDLIGAQMIVGAQEKGIAAGLVSKRNLYNSARLLTKLTGHKDPEEFFTPPGKAPQPGQQPDADSMPIEPPPDPKMAEMQMKAEIEKLQAQADIETQNRKTEAELTQMREKHALEMQKLQAELQRDAAKHQMAMTQAAVKGASQPKQTVKDADGNESVVDDGGGNAIAPLMMMLMDQLKAANAPKKVVRDAQGRVSHVEPMVQQ